jgi:biotin carboxylase
MTNPLYPHKRLLLLVSPNTYRAGAFVDAARRLEVEVVRGVDVPAGLSEWWELELPLDFADVPGAVRAIMAYHERHPFDAVVAVDDAATQIAAGAGTALGLPNNSPTSAEAARDKGIMRDRMSVAGVPCPGFRRFPLSGDPHAFADEVAYPCVVKPLRLSGSRGVIRADGPAQFVAAFARVRRLLLSDGNRLEATEILVEDFIPGVEVALEGLLTDGALRVLALFDKPDPLDGPFFEETIYVTPSRLPPRTQRAVARVAGAAAASIELRHGPVHAELRVNDHGPWMLEIAGRSIGGLCSTVLEFGTSMNLEELILRHALGMDLPSLARRGRAAGVMMIPIPRGGVLRDVQGIAEAREVPHVTGIEVTAKMHSTIVPLPEGSSYLGFIFARASNPATAEAALRTAHARLSFEIQPLLPVLRP